MIQFLRTVIRDACRQHIVLPARRGELEALELLDCRRQAFDAAELILAGDMLPVEQEAQEVGGAHRLDLRAQAVQRVAMDACEEPPVAPFELGDARREASAQHSSLGLQCLQRHVAVRHIEPLLGHRAEHFQPAGDQLERLLVDALEREPRLAALDGPFPQGIQ